MSRDSTVETVDGWVEFKIDRPETMNAIREQTAEELMEVLNSVDGDRSLHGVIISGSEKAFCTGVDTSEQKENPGEEYELWRRRKRTRKVNQMFRTLPEFTKPVIAAVEGFALGGGFELAMLCDLIVAGEGAKFGLPEARLGLMPGGAGTQTLPRLIGKPLAKELMWTGRRLTAEDALNLRIINSVAPTGQAVEQARELAAKIGANAPLSIMFTKSVIERGFDATLAEGMAAEADAFFAIGLSNDKREGLAAFKEKRKPSFNGN